jgi:hypothetical protein
MHEDDRLTAGRDDDRSDAYLWDRSGTADEDIERLERVLHAVRFRPDSRRGNHAESFARRAAAESRPPFAPTDSRGYWSMFALAAAVLLTLGVSLLALRSGRSQPENFTIAAEATDPWSVVALQGEPRIDSMPFSDDATLPAGSWLETDAQSSASVRVADIGTVKLSPQTRLGLVQTSPREHRMDLKFGRIEAFILAPQRAFIVDTPLATAVDLGCQYVLEVDRADGSATLRVTMGWVAFEQEGRAVQIPRDGMCRTYPRIGAGTPHYTDAPARLITALEAFDHHPNDADALAIILDAARERDSLTLWHLLDRAGPAMNEQIARRLAHLAPPPDGVTIDGIVDRNPAMRSAWLESMFWSITW